MANYLLTQTGAEVQALLDTVASPETTQPVAGSSKLITSGAVSAGLAAQGAQLAELGQEVGNEILGYVAIENPVANAWSVALPCRMEAGKTYFISTSSANGRAVFAPTNTQGAHILADEITRFNYDAAGASKIMYSPSTTSNYLWVYAGDNFTIGTIIYVSSNEDSQARDIAILEDKVDGYNLDYAASTGSYVTSAKIRKGVTYRASNKSASGAITLFLAAYNSTNVAARIQTISSGGISGGNYVDFTADYDADYINGYSNAAVNLNITIIDSVDARLDNLEGGLSAADSEIVALKKVTTGESASATASTSGQEIRADISLAIDSGDSVNVSYEITATDTTYNIIALYGTKSDNTRVLVSQFSYPESVGNLTFVAAQDFIGIRVYVQRAAGYSGTASVAATALCFSKGIDDGNEFVNVVDFGADGGGVGDSRTAFVNAIAAAIARHKNVFVPYGVYHISAPILIKTKEPLQIVGFAEEMSGSGRGSVIRASASMNYLFRVENDGVVTKIFFKNLMLDGNNKTTQAVVQIRTGYAEMERVFVINSPGHGVYADRCYYLKLKDVIISTCALNGLYLYSQANVVRVEDCQITNNASTTGYANVMVDMDEGDEINKNCNVLLSSCDLSGPAYNASGNYSVKVKNSLAVTLQNCYFENTDTNEANANYYHVSVDSSVDSFTMFGNFIGMGSVSILAKSGAVFGNDFCTKAVYGEADANALSLTTSADVSVFGNYFWTGYSNN